MSELTTERRNYYQSLGDILDSADLSPSRQKLLSRLRKALDHELFSSPLRSRPETLALVQARRLFGEIS